MGGSVGVVLIMDRESDVDLCPHCLAVLGHPRSATRRLIVLTEQPGRFRWRCPDCRGVWEVRRGSTGP